MQHLKIEKGTLARAPLAGGSPRELLEDVAWADWGPKGELAVVHHVSGSDQIEYPIGHVLHQSNGWISHIRVSPRTTRLRSSIIRHFGMIAALFCWWIMLDAFALCLRSMTRQTASPGVLMEKKSGLTAAVTGYTRSLMAVNDAGKVRTILKIPAGLTLQDMAPDGRVLVSLDVERLAMATSTRVGRAVDIFLARLERCQGYLARRSVHFV